MPLLTHPVILPDQAASSEAVVQIFDQAASSDQRSCTVVQIFDQAAKLQIFDQADIVSSLLTCKVHPHTGLALFLLFSIINFRVRQIQSGQPFNLGLLTIPITVITTAL
jgi:hypothetical protein